MPIKICHGLEGVGYYTTQRLGIYEAVEDEGICSTKIKKEFRSVFMVGHESNP